MRSEDIDVVRERDGFLDVVRDHQNGLSELRLQQKQKLAQRPPRDGVQGGKRFIEQDALPAHHQRPGQGATLSHAARNGGWEKPLEPLQAEPHEQRPSLVNVVPGDAAANPSGKQDVFEEGKPGQKQVLLLHVGAQAAQVRDGDAVPRDVPRIGGSRADKDIEKRSLAAPRGADEDGETARRNAKTEIRKHGQPCGRIIGIVFL